MENQVLMVGISLQLFERLQTLFLEEGILSTYTTSIQDGARRFAEKLCHLLILALPEENKETWLKILAALRKSRPTPIMLLADEWDEDTRTEMLKGGADMCFSAKSAPEAIGAHALALLRRYTLYNHYDISQPDASVLHRGELVIDPIRHRLTLAGNEVRLRRREFRLLLYFAENPGIVLTPEKICETVWMTESHYNRDVSAVIAELRKKLRDNSKHPVYIETVHGVGYRFLPHK